MIQTENTTLAVAQALITLRDENKALKADVERQKQALSDIANIGFEGKIGDKVARETMRRIANSVSAEKGGRG